MHARACLGVLVGAISMLSLSLSTGCFGHLRAREMRVARHTAVEEMRCPEVGVVVTEGPEPGLFEARGCDQVVTYRCVSSSDRSGQRILCTCEGVAEPGGLCPREREDQEMLARRAAQQEREARDAARLVCWHHEYSAEALDLQAIWGDGAGGACGGEDCVFVVGESGTAVHWDGESWMGMRTPTFERLRSIAGRNRRDVFAVGDAGAIIHWDGREWRQVRAETSVVLRSVTVHGREVWAVGDEGVVLRYDGRVFRREAVEVPPGFALTEIRGAGDTLYAVGHTATVNGGGVLLVRERGRWSSRVVPQALVAILAEPRGALVVSRRGEILRVAGSALELVASPEPDILHRFVVRAGRTLLVGGTMRGSEDEGFELITTPSHRLLNGAWVASPDRVLAVGREGQIYRYDSSCVAQR